MAHGFPLPDLELRGSVEVIGSTAYCLNLGSAGKPITIYSNFGFGSLSIMGATPIGTNSTGVFSLLDSSTDNGNNIESRMELYTDLSDLGVKKIRSVRIHAISSGQLELITEHDDSEEYRYYVITPDYLCDRHGFKVIVGKDEKGTYWRLIIHSVAGSYFSLDKLFVRYVKVQA